MEPVLQAPEILETGAAQKRGSKREACNPNGTDALGKVFSNFVAHIADSEPACRTQKGPSQKEGSG